MTVQTFLDGRVVLHCGDCLDVLASLPESSVDSVACDPPYHLVSIVKRFGAKNAAKAKVGKSGAYARASSGFMGKQWDGGDIAFRVELWEQVLRVLKPGGHLVAFSGTRTYHRMACAIEDAGFEIRDQIQWLYGCLDDKTKAVTASGLRSHDQLKIGDRVLSYDPGAKSYQWDEIEEVFAYDISDTVYRISTDRGEQVVSRNHRCIVERGGEEAFAFAEEVARQRKARVPILEDLPALLAALPLPDKGASRPQQDVRAGVHGGNGWSGELGLAPRGDAQGQVDGDVRRLRHDVLAKYEVAGEGRSAGLFEAVQRAFSRSGVESARPQGSRGVVGRNTRALSAKLYGAAQSLMEGRRYLSQTARQLFISALCPLPAGIPGYGAGGWLRDAAPLGGGAHPRSLPHASGVRSPYRPQAAQQSSDQSDAVCDEPRSQTIRGWRGHKAVVGRITPEHYTGTIWCVRVRTGAFVAVRDGFAFPTGNSGFPKSHDVSKGIDKAAGAVGTYGEAKSAAHQRYIDKGVMRGEEGHDGWQRPWMDDPEAVANAGKKYTPATDAAKQWQGWGTALKPANEPICLARKPLIGTLVENVLMHGTGAMNIDGCRVEGWKPQVTQGINTNATSFNVAKERRISGDSSEGRWPANVILSWPEDEYELRRHVTPAEKSELYRWLSENP